jgi:trans-aconitate methyltransferase
LKAEFDQYAADYDRLLEEALPASESDRYFAQYKVEMLGYRSRDRRIGAVLDFGCGTGRSIPFLIQTFPQARVVGFDPSEECLRRARRQFDAHFESEVECLPKRSFDLILAANVFHHVASDRRRAVLEICRSLLAGDGRIALFEHNPFNPATRWVFERCVFDRGAQMLSMSEAKALARSAGLKVAYSAYTLFFPPLFKALRVVEPVFARLPLGAQYYVEMAN